MIDLNNTCFKNDCPAILDYLSKQGYTHYSEKTKHGDWIVIKDRMVLMGGNNVKSAYKQIHLIDGELQYVEEKPMEQDSFNKNGFQTPGFEGEILRKVNKIFIGYVIQDGSVYPSKWTKNGIELTLKSSKFHLRLIKKPWYENKSNFPCLVMYEGKRLIHVSRYKEDGLNPSGKVLCSKIGGIYYAVEKCRPATKEEVLSLLVKHID